MTDFVFQREDQVRRGENSIFTSCVWGGKTEVINKKEEGKLYPIIERKYKYFLFGLVGKICCVIATWPSCWCWGFLLVRALQALIKRTMTTCPPGASDHFTGIGGRNGKQALFNISVFRIRIKNDKTFRSVPRAHSDQKKGGGCGRLVPASIPSRVRFPARPVHNAVWGAADRIRMGNTVEIKLKNTVGCK